MSEHVTAYYIDKHGRAGGLFDVRCNNTWETEPRFKSLPIAEAAARKIELHNHGHLSVSICHAGTFDLVAIW